MPEIIKLHFVENKSEGDTEGQLKAIGEVFTLTSAEECDVIFCASVKKVNEALNLKNTHNKPLVVYCWDYYKWSHAGSNASYEWGKYRELMRKAELILVPSDGQKKRLKELVGLDSVVCECSVSFYDHETSDGNYVLDPVRDYPEENLGWVKRACEELNIPYIHSEHGYSEEEFRKLVSDCTFMTCGYREASTGGLSLMEGLYNGKVSLVSDSPYMGAKNYIGELGFYFKYNNFDDLKEKIKLLWEKRPVVDLGKARKHCEYFTHRAFADRIKHEIECNENTRPAQR